VSLEEQRRRGSGGDVDTNGLADVLICDLITQHAGPTRGSPVSKMATFRSG
jgi:hypothetical protein